MKRIFALVVLLVFAASPCLAGSVQDSCKKVIERKNGAVVVTACPDATHASIVCEDFPTAAPRLTWTAVNDTDSTINYAAAVSGTITGRVGSTTLDITDGSGTYSPLICSNITDKDEVYVQVYFNVIGNTDSDTRTLGILSGQITDDCSGTSYAWRLRANRTAAGTFKVQMLYYAAAGSMSTAIDSAKTDYAVNTWYGARIYWKKNTANVPTWGIQNDVATDSWTSETASSGSTHATAQTKAICVGPGNTTADLTEIQIINIKIDATDYPPVTSP